MIEAGEHQRAFEVIEAAYGSKLYAYVLRRLGNAPDADDAFSDFRLRVLANLDTIAKHPNAIAYLICVARTSAAEHLRRKSRSRERPVAAPAGPALYSERGESIHSLSESQLGHMNELLAHLTPDDMELVVLYASFELTFPEIARIGLSAATVNGEEPSKEALKKETERLRQKYHRLRPKLKSLANAVGLRPPGVKRD